MHNWKRRPQNNRWVHIRCGTQGLGQFLLQSPGSFLALLLIDFHRIGNQIHKPVAVFRF